MPKWHVIYYLLAAFDILTVSGSLYLNHQVMGIYRDSVHSNQQWANLLGEITELGSLAQLTNAPCNDIFDNGLRSDLAILKSSDGSGNTYPKSETGHSSPFSKADRGSRSVFCGGGKECPVFTQAEYFVIGMSHGICSRRWGRKTTVIVPAHSPDPMQGGVVESAGGRSFPMPVTQRIRNQYRYRSGLKGPLSGTPI